MSELLRKFVSVEGEIHSGRSPEEIEVFFGAFESKGVYEDGVFTVQARGFDNGPSFCAAYQDAVDRATYAGRDPHIRWRAHVFTYLLQSRLPGKCIELGTAYGFMFYCGLKYLKSKGVDLSTSQITLVDKFDRRKVDFESGQILDEENERYAPGRDVVAASFEEFGVVQVIQGVVPDILHSVDYSNLSFLHLDLNAAAVEVNVLRKLWPNLVGGAVVVLDDYGFPDYLESRHAHDALANELGYEILSLPTGQGIVLKHA